MGAKSLLGELQGTFGVLHGTGLEELNHSLLVSGHSAHFADHLTDQLHPLAQSTLALGGTSALRLLLRGLESSYGVALVLADSDHRGVALHHYNI